MKNAGTALDMLGRFTGPADVTGNRTLDFGLDVLGTAGTLSTMLPVDLPTLPGFRMPDFKDFNPLAQVANTSGASRADAATALAGYRATISDSLLRGSARISTAAFELSSIAAGLVRNAMAAPAVAASPAGPLGATAFVAGLIADALNNAMQVLEALEKDLHAIAGALAAETSAAMGRAVPGPGPITEKAHGDLQRLASMTAAPAPATPAPEPPATRPAAAVAAPPPPAPVHASAPPPEPTPAQTPGSPVGAAAVAAAKSQLGTPYVWGGAAPGGFDCSGLTSWAYKQAGLDIPRVAADQTVGRQVSYDELQPGDLVLWSGHAAMYAGDGMMIEAGDPVQMNPVRTENLGMTFRGFWRPTG